MKYIKKIFEDTQILDIEYEFQSSIDIINESNFGEYQINNDEIRFDLYDDDMELLIDSENINDFDEPVTYLKFKCDLIKDIKAVCKKLVDLNYNIECQFKLDSSFIRIKVIKEFKSKDSIKIDDFIIPDFYRSDLTGKVQIRSYEFNVQKFKRWFSNKYNVNMDVYKQRMKEGSKSIFQILVPDNSLTHAQVYEFIKTLNDFEFKDKEEGETFKCKFYAKDLYNDRPVSYIYLQFDHEIYTF